MQCDQCKYDKRLAFQAFTDFKCEMCNELKVHGNSATPRICAKCSSANNVCMDCTERILVCVLCGEPWLPGVKNRCECGGFCTWGYQKGADPLSWTKTDEGYVPNPPPKDAK